MGWAARANKTAQDAKAGALPGKARIARAKEPVTPERIARVSQAFGGGAAGGVLAALMLGIAATPPKPRTKVLGIASPKPTERKRKPSMGGRS